jgi:hypothetical protein
MFHLIEAIDTSMSGSTSPATGMRLRGSYSIQHPPVTVARSIEGRVERSRRLDCYLYGERGTATGRRRAEFRMARSDAGWPADPSVGK